MDTHSSAQNNQTASATDPAAHAAAANTMAANYIGELICKQ